MRRIARRVFRANLLNLNVFLDAGRSPSNDLQGSADFCVSRAYVLGFCSKLLILWCRGGGGRTPMTARVGGF
jgi:hypothetical protein